MSVEGKRILARALLLLSIFVLASLLLPIPRFVAAVSTEQVSDTLLKVEPQRVTMGPEPAVGQQFTIDIIVEDAWDLFAWEAQLFWDSSLLNCTAEEYPILPEGLNWEDPNNLLLGPGIEQDYNATHGRWYRGLAARYWTTPFPESFFGTMKLASLTFEVIYQPSWNCSCILKLVGHLAHSCACMYFHRDVDGYYEILSYPPWARGTLRVLAFYAVEQSDGSWVGSFVQVPVIVTGPENHTGITTTDRWYPLTFTVAPGEYSVSGTFDSATQTANVNVSAGSYAEVFFNFGSSPPPPSVPIADVNGDGIVDIFDAVLMARAFGSTPGASNWNRATDVNSDDVVDIFDVVLLAQNFGKTV